jgi:hypothetical protein
MSTPENHTIKMSVGRNDELEKYSKLITEFIIRGLTFHSTIVNDEAIITLTGGF